MVDAVHGVLTTVGQAFHTCISLPFIVKHNFEASCAERFIRKAFLESGDIASVADVEGFTEAAMMAASPDAPPASPARNARYLVRNLSMLSTSMPIAASLSSDRKGSERFFLMPLRNGATAAGASNVGMNAAPFCTSEESNTSAGSSRDSKRIPSIKSGIEHPSKSTP